MAKPFEFELCDPSKKLSWQKGSPLVYTYSPSASPCPLSLDLAAQPSACGHGTLL